MFLTHSRLAAIEPPLELDYLPLIYRHSETDLAITAEAMPWELIPSR